MKKIIFIILLISSSFSFSQTLYQKKFEEKVGNSVIQLNYNWNGFNNSVNNISFFLDKYEVKNSYADFKKPTPIDVSKYVFSNIDNDIKKINASQNRYKIELMNYQKPVITYKISGKINQQLVSQIESALKFREKKYTEEFFKKNYFLWNEKEALVSIDYAKISKIYIPQMLPVSNAFRIKNNNNIYNRRIVINDILSFYQSIPYDTLTSDRGAGFSTPLRFLHENKGDCDTKLVAINSTVKSIYPDIKSIAIVLPNHVLLGFNVPANNNDKKVLINGTTYVLTETAGPSLVPLGVIDPKNEALMKTRNYSIISL
jgi:hypothetical protein